MKGERERHAMEIKTSSPSMASNYYEVRECTSDLMVVSATRLLFAVTQRIQEIRRKRNR